MSNSKEYLNILEEIEHEEINPVDLMTTNEVIDSIQMYDSTIEIIGYVDGIESPRIVGNNKQYKFFKFYLNNGNNKRIQVVAWNDDIDIVLPHVRPNYIIHLDGVQARVPKVSTFNNGNVQFELLIRKNTVVANLGFYEPSKTLNKPVSVQLKEVLNVSGCISLDVYVKSNFTEFHESKLNKLIGWGSVTDGIYKLEVHILNFLADDYYALSINKGDRIEIIGTIQTVNPIYLLVNDINSIQKLEGHMSFPMLLKGVRIPSKRQSEGETSQEISKKRSSI